MGDPRTSSCPMPARALTGWTTPRPKQPQRPLRSHTIVRLQPAGGGEKGTRPARGGGGDGEPARRRQRLTTAGDAAGGNAAALLSSGAREWEAGRGFPGRGEAGGRRQGRRRRGRRVDSGATARARARGEDGGERGEARAWHAAAGSWSCPRIAMCLVAAAVGRAPMRLSSHRCSASALSCY